MPPLQIPEFLPSDHAPGILAGAVALFVLLGLWSGLRGLRREGLNRAAVSAMLLFFLGAGVFAVAKSSAFFPWPEWPTGASLRLVAMVFGTGACALGFISLGLHDRARHRGGRLHATGALLAGGALGAISAGELSLMLREVAAAAPVPGPVVAMAERPPPATSGPTVEIPPPPKPAESPEPREKSEKRELVRVEDRGFEISLAGPWKPMTADGAHPGYRRIWPEVHANVVSELLADPLTVEDYAGLVLDNLRKEGELLDSEKRMDRANDRDFLVLESRVRLPGITSPFRYEHWIHLDKESAWQIVFWSSGIAPARLRAEAEGFMRGFRVLEGGIRENLVARIDDPARGVKAELPDKWKTTDQYSALFQIQLDRLRGGMAVASLPAPSAPVPLDDLGALLLKEFGFEEDEETGKAAREWSPGAGLGGREWRLKRDVPAGVEYEYLLRVATGRHRVWLVMVAGQSGSSAIELMSRNADALVFDDSKPAAPEVNQPAAEFWNQVGLRRFNADDLVSAAPVFRHAFACSGEKDLILLQNAGHAMERAGEIKPALELLSPRAGSGENQIDIQLRIARLLTLDGDVAGGMKSFTSTHEKLLEREPELLAWMKFLHENGHTTEAIRAARWWLEKKPGGKDPRRWLAQSQMLAGEKDAAVAGFRALVAEFPGEPDLVHELAENLNEAGQYQEALATLQPLVTANKATARTYTAIGWSHSGRKWYREAKASFEEALKLSPGDPEIEGHVRDAAAKLGQGNHSSIRDVIEPVPLPAELRARLARETAPPGFGIDHSAVWLQRLTSWQHAPGQPVKRTQRFKVRIHDAEGAESHGTITFPFDPLVEKVHLNRLEVFDEEGRKVGAARTEDAYIRDKDDGMASHDEVLHVPAPGVAPGCTIEWEITVEGFAPVKSFPFERVLFANYLPTWIQAAHVTGDTGAIRSVLRQDERVETLSGRDWKAWVAGPLPPATFEAFSVWAEEEKPYLCLGGDEGSWKTIGLEYLGDLKDRLAVEPAVAKLARQLTRDCPDDASKIAVLARHVQKGIAYKAIEFGTRARLPNTASETMRLNYGDCKDTSLLLHQLLTAAGITSHLALVQNDWRLVEELPTLDQFNHMVVHVPSLGENRFIDPTDKTLDLGKFPADGLWHARLLVLDPKNPRLVSPPAAADPAACGIEILRTVSPGEGKWRVNESLTLTGYYASRMRSAFIGQNPVDQQRRLQSILSAQGNARVESFVFHGLEDPRATTRLEMVYTVQAPMPVIGGSRHAALPALWEKDYLSTPFVKDRKSDFRVVYPMRFLSETKLVVPPGLDEATMRALAANGKSDLAEWTLTAGPSGDNQGERNIRFRFDGAAGRFPAARYAEYHETWEAARTAWEKTIAWTPEEDGESP